MLLDAIKKAVEKIPDRTITLSLTDGSKFTLPPHQDYVSFSPVEAEAEFMVWAEEGGATVISADEVATIAIGPKFKPPSPPWKNKAKA